MMRLLVVGNSSVGKTCLLNRYSDGRFSDIFVPTVGIDFAVKNIEFDNKIIKTQIFDTAGQERFKSIISSYFRNADGVLLVFDVTEEQSFYDIGKYWIPEINANSKKAVNFILVGSKSDLSDKRKISFDQAHEYAKKLDTIYIETSAKSKTNVEEAFLAIVKDIYLKRKLLEPNSMKFEEQYQLIKENDTQHSRSGCQC